MMTMGKWLEKRIGRAGDEAGLTIIEVLVASIVLVLGAGATFGVLAAATKNAQRAKGTQVALDLAQEELERLHSLPYENLALSSQPETANSPLDPGSRVSGTQFALRRNPPGDYAPLAFDAERGVSPESEFFSGDTEHEGIKGMLYRYVVWRDDPSCPDTQCPGANDYKQLVVAVKPTRAVGQGGGGGYVEVQSQLTDPEAAEAEDPEEDPDPDPDPDPTVTAQQFFLSDTPCAASGKAVRVEIVADHLLHNTLGTCQSGLQTGKTLGAPDALLVNDPPDPAPEDPTVPALRDYADDFYLEPTPDTDKGLQIRRDDTGGCNYDPAGTTNPESQVHRWVTDRMPSKFEMGGKVTLEFYTRTLNDAPYPGKLCVYLFERSEAGDPPKATDELLTKKIEGTPYWTFEGNPYWPRNIWTKVRVTMEFEEAPRFIDEDHRLGVALSTEREATPADAIPVMYDHPAYPSRIEVDSLTPLEGG
jgi:hypothetical protein